MAAFPIGRSTDRLEGVAVTEASTRFNALARTTMLGVVLLAALCLASAAHPQGNPAAIARGSRFTSTA